jgi:hypothetical protein
VITPIDMQHVQSGRAKDGGNIRQKRRVRAVTMTAMGKAASNSSTKMSKMRLFMWSAGPPLPPSIFVNELV